MTEIEIKQCLTTLHWSTLTLAEALRIDVGTVVDWYFGRAGVPDEVAQWLSKLSAAVKLHPAPDMSPDLGSGDVSDFDFSSVGAIALPARCLNVAEGPARCGRPSQGLKREANEPLFAATRTTPHATTGWSAPRPGA
jgi:hypothetical protein